MKKEDGIALSQLIDAMQEAADRLEKAHGENDAGNFERAKIEILNIQKKIRSLLR